MFIICVEILVFILLSVEVMRHLSHQLGFKIADAIKNDVRNPESEKKIRRNWVYAQVLSYFITLLSIEKDFFLLFVPLFTASYGFFYYFAYVKSGTRFIGFIFIISVALNLIGLIFSIGINIFYDDITPVSVDLKDAFRFAFTVFFWMTSLQLYLLNHVTSNRRKLSLQQAKLIDSRVD